MHSQPPQDLHANEEGGSSVKCRMNAQNFCEVAMFYFVKDCASPSLTPG